MLKKSDAGIWGGGMKKNWISTDNKYHPPPTTISKKANAKAKTKDKAFSKLFIPKIKTQYY